jgi:hypothetical protein
MEFYQGQKKTSLGILLTSSQSILVEQLQHAKTGSEEPKIGTITNCLFGSNSSGLKMNMYLFRFANWSRRIAIFNMASIRTRRFLEEFADI